MNMLETVLAYILLLFGIVMTIKLRFFSPVKLFRVIRSAFKKDKSRNKNGISPLSSLFTALAGAIGTGNITGVCGAIIVGGPGAVFWMWVSAFFSAALKYSEVYLAVKYKPKDKRLQSLGVGGSPMLYMERGLGRGMKPIAALFAVLCSAASLGIGNAVQSGAVSQTWATLAGTYIDGTVIKVLSGVIVAGIIAYAVCGGTKRITKLCSVLVPLMGAVYIVCAGIVIFENSERIIPALTLITEHALGIRAIGGGLAGASIAYVMRCGIEHGTFSNEAGMGSSPMAHAASDTLDPKKQAALGIIEVFADTLVICTVTALLILTSVDNIPYGEGQVSYMGITLDAFSGTLGSTASGIILGTIMPLFAISSMLTWSYYGKVSMEYLSGERGVRLYLIAFCVTAFLGACIEMELLWEFSSILNLLMTLPNLFAIALLIKKIE